MLFFLFWLINCARNYDRYDCRITFYNLVFPDHILNDKENHMLLACSHYYVKDLARMYSDFFDRGIKGIDFYRESYHYIQVGSVIECNFGECSVTVEGVCKQLEKIKTFIFLHNEQLKFVEKRSEEN